MIIDTPDWNPSSVGFIDGDSTKMVYEPSEDTFLMLDALQQDLECTLRKRLLCDNDLANSSLLVVELGSGAGLLTAAVAKVLNKSGDGVVKAHCMAVDLNPQACLVTAETCGLNGVQADVVRGDLLTWMRWPYTKENNFYGPVDLLLFNPPYVRDPEGKPAAAVVNSYTKMSNAIASGDEYNEDCSLLADAAWLGGGPDGADVLRRALHQAADLLSERGVFYVLMIDYNYAGLLEEENLFRNERKMKKIEDNVNNGFDDIDATIKLLEDKKFKNNNCVLFTSFGSVLNDQKGNHHRKILACRKILSRKVPSESLAIYKIFRPHIDN